MTNVRLINAADFWFLVSDNTGYKLQLSNS
ncbi:hypothetical protein MPLB_1670065 [Mesorhizobium sp. ORS 3324]|nr:hypothetical protein MPLB_1670065 [Mesorhizobium sp. ORS 3324]